MEKCIIWIGLLVTFLLAGVSCGYEDNVDLSVENNSKVKDSRNQVPPPRRPRGLLTVLTKLRPSLSLGPRLEYHLPFETRPQLPLSFESLPELPLSLEPRPGSSLSTGPKAKPPVPEGPGTGLSLPPSRSLPLPEQQPPPPSPEHLSPPREPETSNGQPPPRRPHDDAGNHEENQHKDGHPEGDHHEDDKHSHIGHHIHHILKHILGHHQEGDDHSRPKHKSHNETGESEVENMTLSSSTGEPDVENETLSSTVPGEPEKENVTLSSTRETGARDAKVSPKIVVVATVLGVISSIFLIVGCFAFWKPSALRKVVRRRKGSDLTPIRMQTLEANSSTECLVSNQKDCATLSNLLAVSQTVHQAS